MYTVYVYITGGGRGGILRGLHSPQEGIPLVSVKIAKSQIFLEVQSRSAPKRTATLHVQGYLAHKKLPPPPRTTVRPS